MSGEAWAFLGVCVTGAVAFLVAVRQSRSTETTTNRTASASEVEKLGERLDSQAKHMTAQDERIADLNYRLQLAVAYAFRLQRELEDHKITVPEWPEGLNP